MKRIPWAAFVALVSLLVFLSNGEAITLRIESLSAVASQTSITVPVMIEAEQRFSGVQFNVAYSPTVLKVQSVGKGGLIPSFSIASNIGTAGMIRVGGFDPSLSGVSGSGVVVNLQFEILGPGTSPLTLSGVKFSDSTGKAIAATSVSGSVSVSGPASSGSSPAPPSQSDAGTSAPGTPAESDASQQSSVPVRRTASLIVPSTPEPARPQAAADTATDVPGREETGFPERPARIPVAPTDAGRPGRPETGPAPEPSNNRVLIVQSEYGKPVPPVGATTFAMGEKARCTVESPVILSETEKAVCTGYQGYGAAPSGTTNSVEFAVTADSRIVWTWRKETAGPDFGLELPRSADFPSDGRELRVPVKGSFSGGFSEPVTLSLGSPSSLFQAELEPARVSPDRRESVLVLRRKEPLSAGRYPVALKAESGTVSKDYEVEIVSRTTVTLSELVWNRKTRTAEQTVLLGKNAGEVATFQITLLLPEGIAWKGLEGFPASRKVFHEVKLEGQRLNVAGAFYPPFLGEKLVKLRYSASRPLAKGKTVQAAEILLWDEKGQSIPLK